MESVKNILKYQEGLGWLACLAFLAESGMVDPASDEYAMIMFEASVRYLPDPE